MYVDILFGREAPEAGWYLQAVGRGGKRNSCYLVLSARRAKRRDRLDGSKPAAPRIVMEVEAVDEIPVGAQVFEFRWYLRKKRRTTFEEHMARGMEMARRVAL